MPFEVNRSASALTQSLWAAESCEYEINAEGTLDLVFTLSIARDHQFSDHRPDQFTNSLNDSPIQALNRERSKRQDSMPSQRNTTSNS